MAIYDGDDIMEVIENNIQLQALLETSQTECTVIDTNGTVHKLTRSAGNQYVLNDTNSTITSAEAVTLAQKHLAALNHCCVAKFHAATVRDVIVALVTTDNE